MNGFQFIRQGPFLNYLVDFICKELLLIMEVDGISRMFDDNEKYDRKRQTELEEIGFTILRFQDGEILNNLGDVSSTIKYFVKQRKS